MSNVKQIEGVLEEIFGTKMEGMTCIWRWLHSLKNTFPWTLTGGLIKAH